MGNRMGKTQKMLEQVLRQAVGRGVIVDTLYITESGSVQRRPQDLVRPPPSPCFSRHEARAPGWSTLIFETVEPAGVEPLSHSPVDLNYGPSVVSGAYPRRAGGHPVVIPPSFSDLSG